MQQTLDAGAASSAFGTPPAGPDWVSMGEAGRRLGINKSTVSRQVEKLGVARNEAGQIDLNDYRVKRGEDLNPQMARQGSLAESFASGEGGEGAATPAAPKARKSSTLVAASTAHKALQAQKLQMELDKERGLLISRAEVNDQLFTASRALREVLLSLPERLSGELAMLDDPAAVQAYLDKAINSALSAIAEAFQKCAGDQP